MSEGVLSPGWTKEPLGTLGEWYGGGTPRKANESYWGGKIPWVSPKDMKSFRVTGSQMSVTQKALDDTSLSKYPEGIVLIVVRSGILAHTFPVAVSDVAATMNQDMKGLKPREGVDATYVAYALRRFGREILSQCSKDGTTVASISTNALRRFEIPIAPIEQQRRIVAKIEELFSDLDAGVAALNRAKTNLKRYRAAVLKAAVEGKLTEQWRAENPPSEPTSELLERILAERRTKWEEEQVAKYKAKGKKPPRGWGDKYKKPITPNPELLPNPPVGWCWATLDQCASNEPNSITDGPFGSNLKTEHYRSTGPRVIRLQNIGDGKFIDEYAHVEHTHFERLRKHSVVGGDIVIALLGDTLPRACVVPEWVGPAIVKADCVRFAPHHGVLRSGYANYLLNSSVTRRRCATAIRGVGRPRLNLTRIRGIAIPLPTLQEQEAIVTIAEECLSANDQAEGMMAVALMRAEALRAGVLRRAFAGRLS